MQQAVSCKFCSNAAATVLPGEATAYLLEKVTLICSSLDNICCVLTNRCCKAPLLSYHVPTMLPSRFLNKGSLAYRYLSALRSSHRMCRHNSRSICCINSRIINTVMKVTVTLSALQAACIHNLQQHLCCQQRSYSDGFKEGKYVM